MIDPLGFLLTAGILIVVAFLAQLAFRKLHMPDVPMLILFGALLSFYDVVDPVALAGFAPVVASIALLLLAMDAGLELRWSERQTTLARAATLAALMWLATAGLCAGVAYTVLHYAWQQALLLGFAIGGAGVVAVLPALQLAGFRAQHLPALTLAAAIVDLLAVLAFHLYGSALGEPAIRPLFLSIAVSTVFGAGAGWLWARALGTGWIRGTEYLLTLGVLFVLVAGVVTLEAAGVIAVLSFAVAVANSKPGASFAGACSMVPHPKPEAPGMAKRPEATDLHATSVTGIHREVVFLARALVLVDLGALVEPALLEQPAILMAAGLLSLAVLAARALVVLPTRRLDRWERASAIVPFAPGLGLAVLATLPPQLGTPAAGGLHGFPTVAAATLVVANLLAAILAILVRRPMVRARLADQPDFRRPVKGKHGIRFPK